MRPCPRAGDPSICAPRHQLSVFVFVGERAKVAGPPRLWAMGGTPRVPGGDLEGGAEDLGSHEFGHDGNEGLDGGMGMG
jgi:hypothetical protein